jgi:hypothetical protein
MVATCPKCQKTWSGFRAEHCPADGCHQTFSGGTAGDKHRVGDFADGSRHCLTVEEMLSIGMVVNSRGTWSAEDPALFDKSVFGG